MRMKDLRQVSRTPRAICYDSPMKSLILCAVLAGVVASACTREAQPPQSPPAPFPAGELIDLSHAYDEQTIFWPTAEGFKLKKDADGVTPAGYYYAAAPISTRRRTSRRGNRALTSFRCSGSSGRQSSWTSPNRASRTPTIR